MEKKETKFLERLTHLQILTTEKTEVDLDNIRSTYGDDFNTLFITNTDAGDNIEIYLDGIKSKFVTANNGVFSFDWEAGLLFNFLSIENVGAGTIAANAIKISVGRTGKN